jgi:predicted nucleic acid-binding protein
VSARFLADTSVWSRMTKPVVRETVAPLAERGLLAVCPIVEMEILYGARNTRHRDHIRDMLRGFERCTSNDEVWQRAIEVRGELVARGSHRAVSAPDLIIAATAERHRLTVLHYDGDFDLVAAVTGQPVQWVVPPGTADV